jgi:hypothetical protein
MGIKSTRMYMRFTDFPIPDFAVHDFPVVSGTEINRYVNKEERSAS